MNTSRLKLISISLFLMFGISLTIISCSNDEFLEFESLNDKEVSEILIKKLEEEKYQFVETYFDYLLSTHQKNKDGENRLDSIYSKLASQNTGNEERLFDQWCKKSSHHSAYVVKGHFYIFDGWRDRGTAFAKDTSEEQFRLFHEKLEIAKKAFDEAYKRNKNDVNIHYGMMKICRGLGLSDEELESWYNSAIRVDPTSYNVYAERFRNLLPKWGGSWEAAYNYVISLRRNSPGVSLAFLAYLEFMKEAIYSKEAQNIAGNKSYKEQLDEVLEIEGQLLTLFPGSQFNIITRERLKGGYFFMLNRPSQAEMSFRKIIEVDQEYDWAWYMLGQMYKKTLKKPKEAIEFFNKAIELSPKEAMYYDERGSAAYSAKEYNLCISDLTTAVGNNLTYSFHHSWQTYTVRARCFMEKNNYPAAIDDLTMASQLNPEDNWIISERAKAHYINHDIESAILDMKSIIKNKPDASWAVKELQKYENELANTKSN